MVTYKGYNKITIPKRIKIKLPLSPPTVLQKEIKENFISSVIATINNKTATTNIITAANISILPTFIILSTYAQDNLTL